MKKAILTAVIFTASTGMVASASEAAQLGYNFDAQNGSPTQTDPIALLSSVNLVNGGTFNGIGNPNSGRAAEIFSEGSTAILEFTLTPISQLSLTNFSYDVQDLFSFNDIEVRSSVDSFASVLDSFSPTLFYTTRSFALNSFNNISNPVTFQIRQANSVNIKFDNVNVTAVPFEFSPTFGVAALAGIWLTSKKLKKSSKQD